MCVCKSESKFDITTVPQKGRRDYVTLLRAYNKANPGKSVQVAIKVVREAMGADPPASKSGGVAFMASISSLLGDEVSELDAWLSRNANASPLLDLDKFNLMQRRALALFGATNSGLVLIQGELLRCPLYSNTTRAQQAITV